MAGPSRLEQLRRGYDAWNSGDIEVVVGLVDPEGVWHTRIETYRGHEGIRRALRDQVETLGSEQRIELEEAFEAGHRIVAFILMTGQGSASGVEVTDRIAHLWTFRGDKVIELETFDDREAALAAAGIRK